MLVCLKNVDQKIRLKSSERQTCSLNKVSLYKVTKHDLLLFILIGFSYIWTSTVGSCMQLFIMGGDLLSSSISSVLPTFHSGLSPCENLLLEGRQYVVDVDGSFKNDRTHVFDTTWSVSPPCHKIKSIALSMTSQTLRFAQWEQPRKSK